MNVGTNAATNTLRVYNLPHGVRIKVKSIKHFRKCLRVLQEYDVFILSADADELHLYRRPRDIKTAWLYIDTHRVGYTFFNKSPIRYVDVMTLQEFRKWVRSLTMNGLTLQNESP